MRTTLFWFRNDLRLHDQRALQQAVEHAQAHGQALLLMYVHEPAQDAPTAWGFRRIGEHRRRFLADTLQDLLKRPFIWLGFSAFVILLVLAATSFNRAVRWLGGRRWQMLHRGVYAVAVLAVLHFWWMRAGKQDFAEVLVYAGILAALLGWRVMRFVRRP